MIQEALFVIFTVLNGAPAAATVEHAMPRASEEEEVNLDPADIESIENAPTFFPTMEYYSGLALIPYYQYFYYLTDNFATSTNGDCSWVASQMYLSFLDATRNDNIIDNPYVAYSVVEGTSTNFTASPGVYSGEGELQRPGLQDFYSDFKTNYATNGTPYPVLSYSPGFPVIYSQQATLLEYYLQNNLPDSDVDDYYVAKFFTTTNFSQMFNDILLQLHSGKPVIANTPQHSFVVYGYEPGTTKLVVHIGRHDHSPHELFDMSDFDASHNIQMCVVADSTIGQHTHSHVYFNDNNAYCICGDAMARRPYLHYHEFVLDLQAPNPHAPFKCIVCGMRTSGA